MLPKPIYEVLPYACMLGGALSILSTWFAPFVLLFGALLFGVGAFIVVLRHQHRSGLRASSIAAPRPQAQSRYSK